MLSQISDHESRIERLDLALFSGIATQSDDGDRTSWLAVQRAIRCRPNGYAYLEIGSHLGGSIQQHIVDPRCRRIFSIDRRPLEQPDDRGQTFRYEGNSTERMLANLRSIGPTNLGKLVCFDCDASNLSPDRIGDPPDYCFIDGEHTKKAVLSDFEFCLSVCHPAGVICFHDDWVIFPALREIMLSLDKRNIPFQALKMGGATFGIFLRNCELSNNAALSHLSSDGWRWLRKRRLAALASPYVPKWLHPVARRTSDWLLGG